MSLRTLLSGYAAFGAALLLVPSAVMGVYGVLSLDLVAASLARDVGTLMLEMRGDVDRTVTRAHVEQR
jgi:hypothetical protein